MPNKRKALPLAKPVIVTGLQALAGPAPKPAGPHPHINLGKYLHPPKKSR